MNEYLCRAVHSKWVGVWTGEYPHFFSLFFNANLLLALIGWQQETYFTIPSVNLICIFLILDFTRLINENLPKTVSSPVWYHRWWPLWVHRHAKLICHRIQCTSCEPDLPRATNKRLERKSPKLIKQNHLPINAAFSTLECAWSEQ